MQTIKIGKKFPWKTFFLGILVIILAVALLGFMIPDFGIILANGLFGISILITQAAWTCILSSTFWTGIGIMSFIFFIYFYRKNYAKRRVLVPTTTTALQQGLMPTNPLATTPSSTVVVEEKNVES